MRFFGKTIRAHFLNRPNRFLIRCAWKCKIVSAFLPNLGRLKELLPRGRVIYRTKEEEPGDPKSLYTGVAVKRDGHPIMLHTHKTNDGAKHFLQNGKIPGLEKAEIGNCEVQVGRSRFDFLLREGKQNFILFWLFVLQTGLNAELPRLWQRLPNGPLLNLAHQIVPAKPISLAWEGIRSFRKNFINGSRISGWTGMKRAQKKLNRRK